jgi:hypothetical protein
MSNRGSKRIAIIQSCYIPWRGFFDFIGQVDEYIIFDDVQFAKRHWHNRNKIKTPQGTAWLTIPVVSKGKFDQNIDETMIAETWAPDHWRSIQHAYAKAPHFKAYAPKIESLFLRAAAMTRLSAVNHLFLSELSALLGITTPMRWSTEFAAEGRKTDRLISICKAAGATHYLSGPSARDYIEPEKFAAAGIILEWMDYAGYPDYSQLHGAFEPAVTVLDLLFNVGDKAKHYIGSFHRGEICDTLPQENSCTSGPHHAVREN